MSIPIPITMDNSTERARRVRLLRIWTDICAQVLCDMPDGKSENRVSLDMHGTTDGIIFALHIYDRLSRELFSRAIRLSSPDCEAKLSDWCSIIKPYVA